MREATLESLDDEALEAARKAFAKRHAGHVSEDEVAGWPLEVYLERAHLTLDKEMTRAAILLVGKASATGDRAAYIKTRALDDTFYAKLITDYLEVFGSASRRDIDELLWDKLSDGLTDDQKTRKVTALLTKLKRDGAIRNAGGRSRPAWVLSDLSKGTPTLSKE